MGMSLISKIISLVRSILIFGIFKRKSRKNHLIM
nr:MAG TPA: hypothetical protein [Caudoviricetes sp.]